MTDDYPIHPSGPFKGLSTRDEFIRSAMVAFATGIKCPQIENIAKNAVALADAVLAEAKK